MEKNKLHLIGNAHLDPVWLWRWQEGFAEIKATFQSALDRMEEFPDYIFTSACAAYYEWIEQNEPVMFEKIKARVAEGRWKFVGGWYIQPDCNIPSGESFARHSLYSQRYFKEKFGDIAHTGYNVDSFGHNIGLPQILKQSGMNSYTFMRPMNWEKEMPYNVFNWQGADGSIVKAFRLPISYNSQINDMEKERERLDNIAKMSEEEGIDYMLFYGVGNHGGGATIDQLNLLNEYIEKQPGRWEFSSPDAYFQNISEENLPTYYGDLQHHAPGCYSAYTKIKADNRLCEHTLLTAEQLSTQANIVFNEQYPYEEFLRAWKDVMFNQFHDILGGCSLKSAYNDAAMLHGEALAISERKINFALQKFSWNIDTTNGIDILREKNKDWRIWEDKSLGTPVVIYNPLSWAVTAPIKCGCEVNYVTDCDGNVLPSQNTRAGRTNCGDNYETVFLATVPAYGYTVCRIFKHAESPHAEQENPIVASDTRMENNYLIVEIDEKSGCLSRIYRKDLDIEFLKDKASSEIIDEEKFDTWAHNATSFNDKLGEFDNANVKLVEYGPVKAVIRVESTFASSFLRQYYTLSRNSKQIDVYTEINWQEKRKMLKFSYPVNITDSSVTADAAYAHIERNADGMEDPCQQWVDLHGTYNGHKIGLALVNDSKYGYDALDNTLRMTVLRSPYFAHDISGECDDFCECMDQGLHSFNYSICPHDGDFTTESVVKRAYELNVQPRVIVETFHKGALPCSMAGIQITASNVIATAFKKSQDEKGYILRCYETDGLSANTTIELPLLKRKWNSQFKPGEIKTFYIPEESSNDVFETDLMEFAK